MKVLCCFGLFFGKPNEKTKAEWVGFLKFEYISMRKCDKMQTIFSSFKIERSKHIGVHCRSEGCCHAICPSVRIDCSTLAASTDQLYQPSRRTTQKPHFFSTATDIKYCATSLNSVDHNKLNLNSGSHSQWAVSR
jgi:hypothetical protein